MPSVTIPVPPDRNLFDLARRFLIGPGTPVPESLPPEAAPLKVGQRDTFTVVDLGNNKFMKVPATLQYVGNKAYFWVADDVRVDANSLADAARTFDDKIYPKVTSIFAPDQANGPRISVLNARIPDVGGYFSAGDAYPSQVVPSSNRRETLYINISSLQVSSPRYFSVLSHELQHLVHWRADHDEDSWVQEGLSEFSAEEAGYPDGIYQIFLTSPDTQLTSWPDDPGSSASHYGASNLFMAYMAGRLGLDKLKDLVADPADSIAGVQGFLNKDGAGISFDSVFADWVVANYLDEPQGPYGYQDRQVKASLSGTVTAPGDLVSFVHQYAARYFELKTDPGGGVLGFSGPTRVRLIPTDPPSGNYLWWSNRGDSIDTTLTREFDLSSLTKATLNLRLWFDIEKFYDFAYVEVSPDGGKTWRILKGKQATDENPVANAYGPGYTGKSGGGATPAWVDESIDLTPYVGGKVLLRFEYVTDDATNNNGIAIDDIRIPEVAFNDNTDTDNGWSAQGFFRTDNILPEHFAVQLITLGQKATVTRVPLDSSNKGEVAIGPLGADVKVVVLVVSAMAPVTTETTPFTISLKRP